MALTRMATWKRAGQGKAVLLEVDDRRIEIDHAHLPTLNTAAKLKARVENLAGQKLAVFFHINRDGSVAMAWKETPEVWPEDEIMEEPKG